MKIDERFAEMTREITANRGLILPWRNGALKRREDEAGIGASGQSERHDVPCRPNDGNRPPRFMTKRIAEKRRMERTTRAAPQRLNTTLPAATIVESSGATIHADAAYARPGWSGVGPPSATAPIGNSPKCTGGQNTPSAELIPQPPTVLGCGEPA